MRRPATDVKQFKRAAGYDPQSSRAAGFGPRGVHITSEPRALARAVKPSTRTSIGFRTSLIGVLAASIASLCGCYVPIGAKPNPLGTQKTKQPAGRASPTSGGLVEGAEAGSRLTVNGDTIDAADIWRDARALDQLESRSRNPRAYQQLIDQTAAQLIRDKIAEMLLYQEAALRLSPEVETRIDTIVEDEIRKVVARDYGGIPRRYETHLQSRGRTLDHVRTSLRREIIIARHLEQEIKPRITEPTRAELFTVFQTNKDLWRRPARRSMSLIDLRVLEHLPEGVSDPTPRQLETARAKARSIARTAQTELQSGAEFAHVAKACSNGLHAAEGGEWGWVTKEGVRERFVPAVEALYKLSSGEVSNVIETDDGFFLVRCDELDPGVEPDFESVQPELKERHSRATYNRMIAELVDRLRAKARIEPANLELFHAVVVAAAPPPRAPATR